MGVGVGVGDGVGDAEGRALAAIDIGTNSFHLVVARVVGDGRFEVVAREKEVVRLGSGSGDMKVLQPDAVARGLAALRRFRQVAEVSGATVRAVATSAVREAENRDEFVRRAREEAGVDVEVVAGVEEARLIHLGVLQAVPVFDRRMLLVDIGGGSTELLVGEGAEVQAARSVKLGAIRLTDRFFRQEPVTEAAVRECRDYVHAFVAPEVRDLRAVGFDVAVGSSGTILNLVELALLRRGDAVRTAANAEVGVDELAAVVAELTAIPTARKRAAVPGLDPRRADIIVAGGILLQTLAEDLGVTSIVASDFALREGVILDTLRRDHDHALHHLGDIRARGVRYLADLSGQDPAHTRRIVELALALFDGTADLHGLGEDQRELLEAAAMLANVGLVIAHSGHHRHSYYVIRNSEHLAGFTEQEVEVIAQVARYHRKSAPKAKHPEFAALPTSDQRVVRVLAGLLRVAIALDRGQNGVVRAVACRRDGRRLLLDLAVDGDASLELYTAEHRVELLESALDVEVVLAARPVSGAA